MNKRSSAIMVIFSLLGIAFSIFALIFAAISEKVLKTMPGAYPLGFLVLVVSVLFLAAITTKKDKMTKILSIILSCLMVFVNLILAIVQYAKLISFSDSPMETASSFIYFSISILMLVASVFGLIYFISSFKSENSYRFLKISIIVLSSLVLAYFIAYLVFTIYNGVVLNLYAKVDTLLVLASYSIISTFPLLVLSK